VIDETAPCAAVKGAAVAQGDFAQVGIIADAGHDEVLALGGLLGRRGEAAAELRNPFLRLGGGAIVDRDLVTTLGLEMAGHGIAHHAEPEKCHLRHYLPSLQRPIGPLSLRFRPLDALAGLPASTRTAAGTSPVHAPASVDRSAAVLML
jgi:hypothetical protein